MNPHNDPQRNDPQRNDPQRNDPQRNDPQRNDPQHNDPQHPPRELPFCADHDEAITLLLLDELEGEARTALEEHLLGCDACRFQHEQRARTIADLRKLPAPPVGLSAQRRAALVAAAGQPTPASPSVSFSESRRRPTLAILTSIAAVVLLGLLVATLIVPVMTGDREREKRTAATKPDEAQNGNEPVDTADLRGTAGSGIVRLYAEAPDATDPTAPENLTRDASTLRAAEMDSTLAEDQIAGIPQLQSGEAFEWINAANLEHAKKITAMGDVAGTPVNLPTGVKPSEGAPGNVTTALSYNFTLNGADPQEWQDLTFGGGHKRGRREDESMTSITGGGGGGGGGFAFRQQDVEEALPLPGAKSAAEDGGISLDDYDDDGKDIATFYGTGKPRRGRDAGRNGWHRSRTRETPEARVQRLYHALQRRPGESPRMMFHRFWGDNPFVDTRRDPLSTFALDVDTASYTLTRNYLSRQVLPPKAAIRTEEFVNYFPSNYAAPTEGDFKLYLDLAPSPFAHRNDVFLLKVGIKAREIDESARKPLSLTFVIDVSGSMAQDNRLELVKDSIRVLLDELDERDSVGIVVFESTARDVLQPVIVTEKHKDTIAECLLSLQPGSSTNAQQGLDLGYAMALRHHKADGVNRVVMFSDGVANTGVTTAQGMLARVAECRAQSHVFLSTFGVGMGNHNDELLEQLADKGDGQCAYIDSRREAVRIFRRNLVGTFQPVAREAKVQVEFDPNVVAAHRQIGYENRALAHRDFRNDAIDAGEVNAGHEIVALFELELRPGQRAPLLAGTVSPATVRLRYQQIDAPEIVEISQQAFSSGIDDFENAPPRLRLSAVSAAFADLLRNSYWSRRVQLAEVREVASTLLVLDTPEDGRVAELLALMQQADGLLAQRPQPNVTEKAYDELRYNYYLRQRVADATRAEKEQYLLRLAGENQRLEQELRRLLINPRRSSEK